MTGEVNPDIVDIAAQDHPANEDSDRLLAQVKEANVGHFYSDLIYTISNLRYSESEARAVWTNLLTHKLKMSESLGRNVGMAVAALDYFKNIAGELAQVKIIDSKSFIETERLATTDGLTGLYNHRCFYSELPNTIMAAKESGQCFCVMMIDIDNFKIYNDMNGHVAGDVVLREVAGILHDQVREQDLVFRYGGEEFGVLIRGAEKDVAVSIGDRMRDAVADRTFSNQDKLPSGNLTVSGGISVYPDDGEAVEQLVTHADKLLYMAKSQGKNRFLNSMATRRRHERIPTFLNMNYTCDGYASSEVLATTISRGGISFTDKYYLAVGKKVTFDLTVPPNDDKQTIEGKIAWTKKAPGREEYTYGVKFLDVRSLASTPFQKYVTQVQEAIGL